MKKKARDPELQKWQIRTIGSWIFTIQIMIIMYSGKIFGKSLVSMEIMTPVLLILSSPIIFIFGFETLKLGLRGLYKFYFNMDSLISLGTLVAFLTGILSFFYPIDNFAGVSGMIMTIFFTGKYIETKAKGRATREIRKLLELGAKKARIKNGKEIIEVDISVVKPGDIMVVKPGEKIPTDGIVIDGVSSVDESMVTGESIPIDKKKSSTVIGATINNEGILYIKAIKVGEDTFLSHIIELIEDASAEKVPIQKLADKVTSIFVPTILILSLLTLIGWMILSKDISRSIGVAISVLVIACPCSLGLAVPISLTVGSGIGAKNGVLIRRGEAIQTMKKVKTIVFDKTGTITKGKPEVTDIITLNKIKEDDLLLISASLENNSEHPIAKSIVKFALSKKISKLKKVTSFKTITGLGLTGKIDSKTYYVGNQELMKENKISISKNKNIIIELESNGKTVMIISENKKPIGILAVADTIKEDSKKSIIELHNMGYKTVMITGDNELTAKSIAKHVGIDKVISKVLPEDKASNVKRLQRYGFVAFVGDGINDAPALKTANVGIAIGTGTDIAIEAGDIVLARGNLKGVVQAIKLSNKTFSKIKQNLFWAFFYNVIAIPLAIAGLLNPVIAELAMALSSITVVTNANLLRRIRV